MRDLIKKIRQTLGEFSSTFSAKVLVLAVLFLLLVATILTGRSSFKAVFNEGDISLCDIYAPYDFYYPGEIDEEMSGSAKAEALKNFLPVYDLEASYWDNKRKFLNQFFAEASNIAKLKDVDDNWRIEKLKSKANTELDNNHLLPFLQEDAAFLKDNGAVILNVLSSKIITDNATLDILSAEKKEEIIVRDRQLNVEAKIPCSDLYTKEKLTAAIEKVLNSERVKKAETQAAIQSLLLSILTPNLAYNKAETEARRKAMVDGIAPVRKQLLVKKNELIISKGQRVTRAHLSQLDQLMKKEKSGIGMSSLGGVIILFIVFIVAIPIYLNTYRRKIFSDINNLYLISIMILLAAIMSKSITNSPISGYFTPIPAITMLTAILLDYNTAFMLSIMLSIFTGLIAGNKFNVMIVLLISSMAGVYFIKGVRRRSQILKAGILTGILEFVAICGIGLMNNLEPAVFIREGYWGIASGIAASGIVMFLLPVFEFFFNKTTDISLLELSDLNHPILKKMVMSAPGTYHHSLVVGNLAEGASDAIGANSLLARVGAYYHDIGKIEKPEYFSENESTHKSTHEKLAPSMSALIIQSHVKDGMELAKKYKLKKAIIDFIAQHHGTSMMYYFYQRALEKIDDEERLKEEAFRYHGPKPQSRETAIVLLADAVEASSRTLSDPTPSRIKGLVQKIINNKFIDNQLDECDLTLKDLNKIAAAFVRILTGIFHSRVEYPEENRSKNKKNNQ